VAGVTSVTAESGATWSVTFTSSSGSVVKTGTGTGVAQAVTLTAANSITLGTGAVSTSVSAQDAAGNVSLVNTGGNFTLSTVLAIGNVTADNVISSTDNEFSVSQTVTGTLSALGNTATIQWGDDPSTFNLAKGVTETGTNWSYTFLLVEMTQLQTRSLSGLSFVDIRIKEYNSANVLISTVVKQIGLSVTPLMLDLNGDGIHTVGLSAGIVFDVDADGQRNRTGWVDGNDGLLVLDLNQDGVINDGRELFGNGTALLDGTKAMDGYGALGQYDLNKDMKIDANDAIFTELKLWVDANTDGVTDAGELMSLSSYGVASLGLDALSTSRSEHGNNVILESSWTDKDGVSHQFADLTLITDGRTVFDVPLNDGEVTGSTGADVFRFIEGDSGVVKLVDFNASQKDILDFSRLLKDTPLSANSSVDEVSKFVQMTQIGTDTEFKIDTGGHSNFSQPSETILVTHGGNNGLDTTFIQLVHSGHVILG
jgi:hypothetical protein